MLLLLSIAGWENVLYTDTDSIIVGEKGFQRLEPAIDSLKLGYLKIEGTTDNLEIMAKKAYRFGDKEVIKGVKKKAKRLSEGTYQQEYFTTLNYGFRSGDLGSVQTYDIEVHTRNIVTNAIVESDGTVRPRQMSMTQDTAWEIVKPESSARWTWWVDVNWIASLAPVEPRISRSQWEPPAWWLP